MTFYKVYGILISGEKIEKTLREAAMKKIIVVTPWDEPLAEVVAVREIHGEEMEIEPVKLTFSSSEAAIMFIRSHPEDFVYVKMTDMLCNQVMFEDIPFRKFIYGEKGNLTSVVEIFHQEMPAGMFGEKIGHPLYCLRQIWKVPESLIVDEPCWPASRFN